MSSERAQLWMFHFRCPLCGSAPGAVPLRSYLEGWRIADRAMVADLLENTSASLLEVFDRTGGWPTKKVKRELERFWSAGESFSGRAHTQFVSHLTRRDSSRLRYDAACVFCYTPPGTRKADNYFTIWHDACRVQTGNLLYEVGLVPLDGDFRAAALGRCGGSRDAERRTWCAPCCDSSHTDDDLSAVRPPHHYARRRHE
jgi:hypothetical protein